MYRNKKTFIALSLVVALVLSISFGNTRHRASASDDIFFSALHEEASGSWDHASSDISFSSDESIFSDSGHGDFLQNFFDESADDWILEHDPEYAEIPPEPALIFHFSGALSIDADKYRKAAEKGDTLPKIRGDEQIADEWTMADENEFISDDFFQNNEDENVFSFSPLSADMRGGAAILRLASENQSFDYTQDGEESLQELFLQGLIVTTEDGEVLKDVHVSDFGGFDVDAQPGTTFTITYSATHPQTGKEFTQTRDVIVTASGIMPVNAMPITDQATLHAFLTAGNSSPVHGEIQNSFTVNSASNWGRPLGTFQGILDGKGCTITFAGASANGLIDIIGGDAIVKNFTINVTGSIGNHLGNSPPIGALASTVTGNATIEDISVVGVGGTRTISGNGVPVGGLIGQISNPTGAAMHPHITNVNVTGLNVSNAGGATSHTGGMIGDISLNAVSNQTVVDVTINNAHVLNTNVSSETGSTDMRTGGFVGRMHYAIGAYSDGQGTSKVRITNASVRGQGTSYRVQNGTAVADHPNRSTGGFVGLMNTHVLRGFEIKDSYVENITLSGGGTNIGGFVGRMMGSGPTDFENIGYGNTLNVDLGIPIQETPLGAINANGIIGGIAAADDRNPTTIKNARVYNTGSGNIRINGGQNVGGIIGVTGDDTTTRNVAIDSPKIESTGTGRIEITNHMSINNANIGGIVGRAGTAHASSVGQWSRNTPSPITNAQVLGNVSIGAPSLYASVGGIVGRAMSANHAGGTTNYYDPNLGPISRVGSVSIVNATVSNMEGSITIYANGNMNGNIGGLVGFAAGDLVEITDSSVVDILAKTHTRVPIHLMAPGTMWSNVGGAVGYLTHGAKITGCVVKTELTLADDQNITHYETRVLRIENRTIQGPLVAVDFVGLTPNEHSGNNSKGTGGLIGRADRRGGGNLEVVGNNLFQVPGFPAPVALDLLDATNYRTTITGNEVDGVNTMGASNFVGGFIGFITEMSVPNSNNASDHNRTAAITNNTSTSVYVRGNVGVGGFIGVAHAARVQQINEIGDNSASGGNIVVNSVVFAGGNYGGGFVGRTISPDKHVVSDNTIGGTRITNAHVDSTNVSAGNYAGGFAGALNGGNSLTTDCSVNGSEGRGSIRWGDTSWIPEGGVGNGADTWGSEFTRIHARRDHAGGFAGYMWGGNNEVHSSWSERVNVTATRDIAGGFVGRATWATIEDCYTASANIMAGRTVAGGFIGSRTGETDTTGPGHLTRSGVINARVIATLSTEGRGAGGFAGLLTGNTIGNILYAEKVDVHSAFSAGGFAGSISGGVGLSPGDSTIENTYVWGKVFGDRNVGGYVGYHTSDDSADPISIKNSYSAVILGRSRTKLQSDSFVDNYLPGANDGGNRGAFAGYVDRAEYRPTTYFDGDLIPSDHPLSIDSGTGSYRIWGSEGLVFSATPTASVTTAYLVDKDAPDKIENWDFIDIWTTLRNPYAECHCPPGAGGCDCHPGSCPNRMPIEGLTRPIFRNIDISGMSAPCINPPAPPVNPFPEPMPIGCTGPFAPANAAHTPCSQDMHRDPSSGNTRPPPADIQLPQNPNWNDANWVNSSGHVNCACVYDDERKFTDHNDCLCVVDLTLVQELKFPGVYFGIWPVSGVSERYPTIDTTPNVVQNATASTPFKASASIFPVDDVSFHLSYVDEGAPGMLEFVDYDEHGNIMSSLWLTDSSSPAILFYKRSKDDTGDVYKEWAGDDRGFFFNTVPEKFKPEHTQHLVDFRLRWTIQVGNQPGQLP
jgi:hypothetical protein